MDVSKMGRYDPKQVPIFRDHWRALDGPKSGMPSVPAKTSEISVLFYVGNNDRNTEPQCPAAGAAIVLLNPPKSFQKIRREATMRCYGQVFTNRQLYVAVLCAEQSDGVIEDSLDYPFKSAVAASYALI